MDRGPAVCDQSRGKFDLYTDSVWPAEPATGGNRYRDRLGDNHLDDGGNLASLPVAGRSASAVPRLGFDCDGAAIEHYLDELVMENHEHYMRLAIELAFKVPDLPFASVIVDQDSGEVVAEGWNKSSVNPTWHGEIDAINRMIEAACDWKRRSLALYTTAEPCPMCQGAIHWTGIERVVFGSSIRFLQSLGWKQIDIPAQEVAQRTPFSKSTVMGGILEDECNALFKAASF